VVFNIRPDRRQRAVNKPQTSPKASTEPPARHLRARRRWV